MLSISVRFFKKKDDGLTLESKVACTVGSSMLQSRSSIVPGQPELVDAYPSIITHR